MTSIEKRETDPVYRNLFLVRLAVTAVLVLFTVFVEMQTWAYVIAGVLISYNVYVAVLYFVNWRKWFR